MSKIYNYALRDGILHGFYNESETYYNNEKISIKASTLSGSYYPENAFNFNYSRSNYWISASKEPFISFCFKKGNAFLTGYEIMTSSYESRPFIWSFSGSNDNKHWKDIENAEHSMSKSEVFHVDWNHGPYKCFKLTSIKSITGGASSDVMMIEIFGTYFINGIKHIQLSCPRRYNLVSSMVL